MCGDWQWGQKEDGTLEERRSWGRNWIETEALTGAMHPAFSWRFRKMPSAPTHHFLPPGPLQWLPNGLLSTLLPASHNLFFTQQSRRFLIKWKSDCVTLFKMPQLVPIISVRATKPWWSNPYWPTCPSSCPNHSPHSLCFSHTGLLLFFKHSKQAQFYFFPHKMSAWVVTSIHLGFSANAHLSEKSLCHSPFSFNSHQVYVYPFVRERGRERSISCLCMPCDPGSNTKPRYVS